MADILCPICNAELYVTWENSGHTKATSWFTGLYTCRTCGHMSISGTGHNGNRKIVQFRPGCPDHGTDPVFLALTEDKDLLTHDTAWVCGSCVRRFEVKDGKLITTWIPRPYAPMFISGEFVDRAIQRLGGVNSF